MHREIGDIHTLSVKGLTCFGINSRQAAISRFISPISFRSRMISSALAPAHTLAAYNSLLLQFASYILQQEVFSHSLFNGKPSVRLGSLSIVLGRLAIVIPS